MTISRKVFLILALLSAVMASMGCPGQRATPPADTGGGGDKGGVAVTPKGHEPMKQAPAAPPKYAEVFAKPVLMPGDEAEFDKHFNVPGGVGHGSGAPADAVAFTPDGKQVLALARPSLYNISVVAWRSFGLPDGKPSPVVYVGTADQTETGRATGPAVYVSPDGKRALVAGVVYDLANRKPVGDPLAQWALWHPNGKWITASSRGANVSRLLLDAKTGKPADDLGTYALNPNPGKDRPEFVEVVLLAPTFAPGGLVSPDGKFVAGAGRVRMKSDGSRLFDDKLALWLLPTSPGPMRELAAEAELPGQLVFTPDGRWLAGVVRPTYGPLETDRPDLVRVWRVSDGQKVAEVKVPATVHDLAASPDGHWLAAACGDGVVRLLSAATGAEVGLLKGHSRAVHCVAFSADGKHIASGSADGSVRVWKAE